MAASVHHLVTARKGFSEDGMMAVVAGTFVFGKRQMRLYTKPTALFQVRAFLPFLFPAPLEVYYFFVILGIYKRLKSGFS